MAPPWPWVGTALGAPDGAADAKGMPEGPRLGAADADGGRNSTPEGTADAGGWDNGTSDGAAEIKGTALSRELGPALVVGRALALGTKDCANEGLGLHVGSAVVRRAAVRARAPVLRLIISADYVLTMSLDNL